LRRLPLIQGDVSCVLAAIDLDGADRLALAPFIDISLVPLPESSWEKRTRLG
jgi:hypothetical protein